MRVALLMFCGLLASGTSVAAADLTGRSFVQDGEKLINNCGAGPNISGEVQGQKVTFRVPTGRSDEFTAVFVGTLDTRGIAISGTWELVDRNGRRQGKFIATRVADTK
jgi:hypothetical protein